MKKYVPDDRRRLEIENDNNRSEKSPHILNTSANMLGLCFIVLTSIKMKDESALTIVDEFTAVAIVFFMVSCILSFLSMRSKKELTRLEYVADIVFFIGLFLLLVITILITFNVIK